MKTELLTGDAGLLCMDLLSLLGPTPVSIEYYVGETGASRSKVAQALEYLVRTGKARPDRSHGSGMCYAAADAETVVQVGNVLVVMEGSCLGVMGAEGDRTVVRATTDGRFVVMTAKKPYRLIRTFDDVDHARNYNAKIHAW